MRQRKRETERGGGREQDRLREINNETEKERENEYGIMLINILLSV